MRLIIGTIGTCITLALLLAAIVYAQSHGYHSWSDIRHAMRTKPMLAGASTKEQCDARGGYWGPEGMAQMGDCTLPTQDAGKVCVDSQECQGWCTASANQLPGSGGQHGHCSAIDHSFGCQRYLNEGVVGEICVD